MNVRYKIGRVWMSIIKVNNDVLLILFDNLFTFFIENLKYEHYELNFNACDFFNFVIQDNNKLMKEDKIILAFKTSFPM